MESIGEGVTSVKPGNQLTPRTQLSKPMGLPRARKCPQQPAAMTGCTPVALDHHTHFPHLSPKAPESGSQHFLRTEKAEGPCQAAAIRRCDRQHPPGCRARGA